MRLKHAALNHVELMVDGHNGALGQHAASHVEVVTHTDTERALTQHHLMVERTVLDLIWNLRTATHRTVMNAQIHMYLVLLFAQGHARISGS